MFRSVLEFLESQIRGRPQTFEEIVSSVGKSRSSCFRELNGLMIRRLVGKLDVVFNGRRLSFYTLKESVHIKVSAPEVVSRVFVTKDNELVWRMRD